VRWRNHYFRAKALVTQHEERMRSIVLTPVIHFTEKVIPSPQALLEEEKLEKLFLLHISKTVFKNSLNLEAWFIYYVVNFCICSNSYMLRLAETTWNA
jgi:hypothetical protein